MHVLIVEDEARIAHAIKRSLEGQSYAVDMHLSGIKFLVALFALQQFSTVTVLYPASLVFTNGAFVALILVRRKQLGEVSEVKHG